MNDPHPHLLQIKRKFLAQLLQTNSSGRTSSFLRSCIICTIFSPALGAFTNCCTCHSAHLKYRSNLSFDPKAERLTARPPPSIDTNRVFATISITGHSRVRKSSICNRQIFAVLDFHECYVCWSANLTYPGGGKDEETFRNTTCEVSVTGQCKVILDHIIVRVSVHVISRAA